MGGVFQKNLCCDGSETLAGGVGNSFDLPGKAKRLTGGMMSPEEATGAHLLGHGPNKATRMPKASRTSNTRNHKQKLETFAPFHALSPGLASASSALAGTMPVGERSAQTLFCFSLAAFIYSVDPALLFQKTRCVRRVSEARQVGMYLANIVFDVTHPEIAMLLRRDRTTVRHGIRCVEERRENTDFDELLGVLEGLARTVSGPNAAALIWNGVYPGATRG